jgi:hypothetical protein
MTALNHTVQFLPNFTSPTRVAFGASQQFSPISGASPFTSKIQAIVFSLFASFAILLGN